MHAPIRSEFTTSDPQEAHSVVAAAYAVDRLRVLGAGEQFRFELARDDLGEVYFDRGYSKLSTEYEVSAPGVVAINRVIEGELQLRTDGVDRLFGPGDVFLVSRPDREYEARVGELRVTTVALQLSLLTQETAEPGDDVAERLRYEPITGQQTRHWQSTVDYVSRTVLGNGDAASSPLVLGATGRLMAATLLTIFGDEPVSAPTGRFDTHPASVNRATAYIEANPDLNIGVADIARAAHVSVRALQLAFRRHLETTPMRYLRRVRLDLARGDLLAAGVRTNTTVSQVATRWGYADMSQFAAIYRAAYGELPHVTLRRSSE